MNHHIEPDMDAISLVLEALVTGGANGKIQEAYGHLKKCLMESFSKQTSPDAVLCAEVALKEYEKDPEVWKEPLRKALTDAGIAQDAEIIQAAQKILQKETSDHEHVKVHNKGTVANQFIAQKIEGDIHIGEKEVRKRIKRPLGILKGKASYKIKGDFKITDDELLSS